MKPSDFISTLRLLASGKNRNEFVQYLGLMSVSSRPPIVLSGLKAANMAVNSNLYILNISQTQNNIHKSQIKQTKQY